MKIERYNQIVWGVLGTFGLVIVLLAVVAPFLRLRFFRAGRGVVPLRTAPAEPLRAQASQIVYGIPIVTTHSEFIMIPVARWQAADGSGSAFLSVKSGGSDWHGSVSKWGVIYHGFSWGPFHNVVFYHRPTGKSHLLLDKKAVVTSFYFPYERGDGRASPTFLLFGLIEADTNGNGALDERDGEAGYFSDLSGRNLQRLTPPEMDVVSWHIDEDAGLIILRVRRDSDGDRTFTDRDAMSVLRVAIDSPGPATEFIDEAARAELARILQ